MNNTIINVESILKSYSTKAGSRIEVLKGISLQIKHSEFLAIVGPSGVGKSTLLHILGLLDNPDSGNISLYINQKEYVYAKLKSSDISEIRNKMIGFIFQFHHLLPEFNSLENVMMPALIAGESYSSAKRKAEALLDRVGIVDRALSKPKELSGGEQQRVAIVRAIINNPPVIFADEPTGNLDSANSTAILDIIRQLQKDMNLTFIVATHSQEIASAAERIISMKDGKVTSDDRK